MVDGKLKVWVKKGKFSFHNDLYVKVLCDTTEIGKTEDADSFSPAWDHTITKSVDAPFEKLVFQLLDEDTFSRDDLLGTCALKFADLAPAGVFATLRAVTLAGDLDMLDADGERIGHLEVSVEFKPDC